MDLKPCPFCNSESLHDAGIVHCNGCQAEVDSDVWNHRPIEDELRKRAQESDRVCKEALANYAESAKDYIALGTEVHALRERVEGLEGDLMVAWHQLDLMNDRSRDD